MHDVIAGKEVSIIMRNSHRMAALCKHWLQKKVKSFYFRLHANTPNAVGEDLLRQKVFLCLHEEECAGTTGRPQSSSSKEMGLCSPLAALVSMRPFVWEESSR